MGLDPTATHLPVLARLFDSRPIRSVLEFGCGLYSTRFFVERGCVVTSIEMQNAGWYERIKADLPGIDIRLALGSAAWRGEVLADRYDMIFVDGHKDSRPECMIWAKDHTDLIVAHDTEHPCYKWERADMSGFSVEVFRELSPWTTVWRRK